MNNNMGCIDTQTPSIYDYLYQEMNNNMGCIDTQLVEPVQEQIQR